ncbi:MAG: outer membrane lipoprotein-sorting protein [bacterium]
MKLKHFAALVIFFVIAAAAARGEEEKKEEGPEAMLAGMTEAFKEVKDYSAKFEWVEMKEKKEERQLCDFIFMKPDYQRIKVLAGGDKGSSAAYNPSKSTKKVAAKRGFFPTITLAKDSEMLGGFFDAGIYEDIDAVQGEAKNAEISELGEEKVGEYDTVKIEIVPEEPKEYSKTIAWIDKKTNLPIKVEYYKKDNLYGRKTWTDLKLNVGLGAKDFVP